MRIANTFDAKHTALSIFGIVALTGATFWACDSSGGGNELPTSTGAGTSATGGGGTGLSGSGGGVGGGFDPLPSPCRGHAGEIVCVQGVAVTCDANEQAGSEQDCADEVCVPAVGCQLCVEGQYKCEGNELFLCEAGPLHWTSQETCVVSQNDKNRCDPTQGACVALSPIGNGSDNPTGMYYLYANFDTSNSPILSGVGINDVDSYGNFIYVNHSDTQLGVYMVELLDSDGDGEFEPNQHPLNPDDTGPIEERVLTHIATYATDMGDHSGAEIYATADRLFFVDRDFNSGEIFEYVLGGTRNTVLTSDSPLSFAMVGYDEVNDTWYGARENRRVVHSYHAASNTWVPEFEYPDLTGGHFDGLEVVVDPNDGTPYVYVSDMTSDFIGQYVRERGNSWRQVNLFEYEGPPQPVEGMGFGALNHFWAGGNSNLYELGGGDLQKFTEEEPPPR